jgi:hypothetical protein
VQISRTTLFRHSLQRETRFDVVEYFPRHPSFTVSAVQHLSLITFYEVMNFMQVAEISSNAIVAIVTTQNLIQVHHLFPYWQMPHSPHQVTQVGYAASKPRLLSTKAHFESSFPVVRAIEGETQKVNRLWSFPASFARRLRHTF